MPSTDRAVAIQVVITAVAFIVASVAMRKTEKEYRLLVWGLFSMVFAWFAVRALH